MFFLIAIILGYSFYRNSFRLCQLSFRSGQNLGLEFIVTTVIVQVMTNLS